MCGVIGLTFERALPRLGLIAAELLKTLEYRGYDSTGAVIQGLTPDDLRLAKGVGAPSTMVHTLGIAKQGGATFCGQVRWATFGAVTDANSQPHLVRCKTTLYGAHNGNVTNCDDLKLWLQAEGHRVLSDNDGEMVVHTIEHFFALGLEERDPADRTRPDVRRACMRAAIVRAGTRLQGSFAAVVVDPLTRTVWAIKAGSSLYFGYGADPEGGAFRIASSDLSSVLKLTRVLVPMQEGEFAEYEAGRHQLYLVADGTPRERGPVRSRLRAKDTALNPPFETFMEQEIAAQEDTCRAVVTAFRGGSDATRALGPYLREASAEDRKHLAERLDSLLDEYEDDAIRARFHAVVDAAPLQRLLAAVPDAVKQQGIDAPPAQLADRLASTEAGFLADLLAMARGTDDLVAVRLLDTLLEVTEQHEYTAAVSRFLELTDRCLGRGGRIYVVCCGSSFHAAKAACLFFNELAATELIPILPGDFRGQYSRSLRDGDLFIAVSQSGETKDLIDILNSIIESGRDIGRVALVNNVNSTLAQEKCQLCIPLRCGPEVAVPATKSFMNQMVVFYCLALRLGQQRQAGLPLGEPERAALAADLERRWVKLPELPALMRETLDATSTALERAAQLLYLAPSIHILATRITAVAKEGALKVREVVLNHTEGFEGSEFKHGPNTILGFNTLWGPGTAHALLERVGATLAELLGAAAAGGLPAGAMPALAQAVTDSLFHPARPFALGPAEQALYDRHVDRQALLGQLYADYPLIYITGPDPRDVHLTVSQINTHKIRGANSVVIAEPDPALEQASSRPPADNPGYAAVYVPLPRTGDTLMAVFTSTIVLQRLALRMSLLKAAYLDRLGVKDHGVHPDVPKNVSKSITVD
jgi:glucosamine 6-phosphate synthetase-like amidotransferase/phosphosugar isomerase protein